MSRTQKPIDKSHPDWKSTVNDLREKQINDYKKSLRTVMQMGAHSKGTKFGPGGKVLGSSGLGPTTDSNRYRRALRTALARHIDAKDPETQWENTVQSFKPNVLPLDVRDEIARKEQAEKNIRLNEEAVARNLEGRRATAATLRDEANKPKEHDLGDDAVGDENREKQGSYGKGRSGGRKTRRRHRNKSHKKKSHKKKSHKKKSHKKKSHKKSKRHRRH